MSRQILERSLPQATDAERSLLGAVFVNNNHFDAIAEALRPEDFYMESHRTIYRAMATLRDARTTVDLITMQDELLRTGSLDNAGGIGYLSSLMDGIPYHLNTQNYIDIILDRSLLRQAIHASSKIMTDCFDRAEKASEILDRAGQSIFQLADRRIRGGFVRLSDMTTPAQHRLTKLYTEREMVTGVTTGFKDLDLMTSGLQPADLVIIAARPSMGKTALALNIATHLTLKRGEPVGIFSLEMAKEQLLMRMLCGEAQIESHRVRTGFIDKDDYRTLGETLERIKDAPLFIDDSPGLTLRDMGARCRKLAAEHKPKLIIVDYLQLMQGVSTKENRTQEITGISRGLKALAKELNVPVIALSQLSRAPEQRHGNHRPQLSDLRESGSIEQDADVVLFIFREELYGPTEENRGKAEAIIAKQRNGPTGTVKLAFLKQYTKFENLLEL